MTKQLIKKIISGGQTGVDRAALDIAIFLNIPHGGFCPKGRIAEDGVISSRYHLQETPERDYVQRTEWNVCAADGTLILAKKPLTGGTLLTIKFAQKLKKPYLVFDLFKTQPIDSIVAWIEENHIKTLNIAGPRASSSAGIYSLTYKILRKLLG